MADLRNFCKGLPAQPLWFGKASPFTQSNASGELLGFAKQEGSRRRTLEIVQLPALEDNYFYLLIHQPSQEAHLIDPADAKLAKQALKEYGGKLSLIINTHHHYDHTAANLELKQEFACAIAAAAEDAQRIPGFNRGVRAGEMIQLGDHQARVIATPGHTRHHISLYFSKAQALFCGDTLFSGGCGRLFEGTAEQMVDSLYNKLLELPDETQVFCGHEYTLQNLQFARQLESKNRELSDYYDQVVEKREHRMPTIPSTLGLERKINPFLRCSVSDELYKSVNSRYPVQRELLPLFAALRKLKDEF